MGTRGEQLYGAAFSKEGLHNDRIMMTALQKSEKFHSVLRKPESLGNSSVSI